MPSLGLIVATDAKENALFTLLYMAACCVAFSYSIKADMDYGTVLYHLSCLVFFVAALLQRHQI